MTEGECFNGSHNITSTRSLASDFNVYEMYVAEKGGKLELWKALGVPEAGSAGCIQCQWKVNCELKLG